MMHFFDNELKKRLFKNYYRDGFSEEIPDEAEAMFGLYVQVGGPWTLSKESLDTPVFIFQNKNKRFVEYLDSILDKLKEDQTSELSKAVMSETVAYSAYTTSLENFQEFKRLIGELQEGLVPKKWSGRLPIVKGFGIEPLRWCHAECALIPTKRSLNVLFFEAE